LLSAVVYIVELIICYLLQHTVFSWLSISSIVPDLIVVLVVAVAYQKGKVAGIFIGIAGGLMLDLQFGGLIGVYALVYMFIGYFCGFLANYYIKNDTMLPLSMIAISEFVFLFYGYIVNVLIKGRLEFVKYFSKLMLPKIAYTAIVGIILFKIFDFIYYNLLMEADEEN